jgi:hypothetical protein
MLAECRDIVILSLSAQAGVAIEDSALVGKDLNRRNCEEL